MASGKKLTSMQRKFVREYKNSGSATDAARKAGYKYPRRTASRLTNAHMYKHVQEALKKETEKADKKAWFSIERRMELLEEIAEDRRFDDKGRANDRDRTHAIDIVNKMESVYIQKTQDVTELPSKKLIQEAIKILREKYGFEITEPEGWTWD